MTTAKRRQPLVHRLTTVLAVASVAVASLVALPQPTAAFDLTTSSPASTNTYRYDTQFTVGQSFKNRISNAASEWSNEAEGSVSYSSGSSSKVGYRYQTGVAAASAPCVSGGSCTLWFNLGLEICNQFYYGTSSYPGVSDSNIPGCPDGTTRIDSWGVLVHEFGHWRGLLHNVFGTCTGAGYAPQPESNMASMCYDENSPAKEGGTGDAGIAPRRAISQDEIQGVRVHLTDDLVANYSFTECSGCSWDDAPRYWMFTPNSNHWWGSGTVSLNNNTTVPYPEIKQRVRGIDADSDNDGRFLVAARVKAIHSTVNPRAVVFVRHVHGSTTDHEKKCDSGTLTVGVWTTVTCTVDLTNWSGLEFEYGVRVTEKINIAWVTVEDL